MKRITNNGKLPIIILNLDKLRVNKMSFKLSETSINNLAVVDCRIYKIINLALTISVIDFGVPKHGGFRTKIIQKKLFDKGLSKCDGTKIKSKHQLSIAFDVFAYVDGKASWDRYHLTQVAASILQASSMLGYSLEWGGLWKKFTDMPHFELTS